jgi:hypothetical protein
VVPETDGFWGLLGDVFSFCTVVGAPVVVIVLLLRWTERTGRQPRAPWFVAWVGYILVALDMIVILALPAAALAEMGHDGGGAFVCEVPLWTVALMASASALIVTTLWLIFVSLRWRRVRSDG